MRRRIPWVFSRRRGLAYGFGMTRGGALFSLGTALIGLAAVDADINLLMMIFGLCLGGLIVNALYGWRTLRGISVRRILPDVAVAGQSFVIRYAITNRGRWGCARNLLIRDVLPRRSPMQSPEAFVPVLRPGETLTLSVPAVARSRGRVTFSNVKVLSRYPFHLFTKWIGHYHKQEIIVFPALARLLGEIKPDARSAETMGAGVMAGHRKGDDEYYGVREYREGDNPRRIHWRRSAQTGRLMIREMAQARSDQLWCVLNTRVDSGDARQAALLERAMSAAATVICDALERGGRIGLICNGEPLVVLPPGSGRAYRPRLLRELAIRPPNTDEELTPRIQGLSWPARWHGPCLLFGATESADLRTAAAVLGRAVGPVTIHIPGKPAFDSLFGEADTSGTDLGAAGNHREALQTTGLN